MTSSSFFKKFGTKLVLALTLICLAFTSLFCFTACKEEQSETQSDPTYSYTEKDDGLISNGAFAYGVSSIDFTTVSSLPRTSVTGWTKSSSTSDINSGVIDVSDKGWSTLIERLYSDSDFLPAFGIDKNAEKTALKGDKTTDPTTTEIKDYIIEKYFSGKDGKVNLLPNPGKSNADDTDTKVYMLNNYDKDRLGNGVSQNITSASTITLKKGQYGKFTVSVKTDILSVWGEQDFGAYIGVNNTFNGTSQSQYRIDNITSEDWTTYTVYVKADEVYDTTVTLVLGLGTDDYATVEGTAYFDNVTFEHLTTLDTSALTASNMIYANTDSVVTATFSSDNVYLYDMSLDEYVSNVENETKQNLSAIKLSAQASVTESYTVSNSGAKGDKFGTATVKTNTGVADSKHIADQLNNKEITLDKASYTLTYSSDKFVVQPEQYTYVEFYVKNQLSKFNSTAITFDVFETTLTSGVKNAQYKTKAIATVSEASEDWVKVGLIIKNNFESGVRSFIIDVVLGPVDVASASNVTDYASGTVIITDPLFTSGFSTQYDKNEKENDNYNLYSLLNNSASGTVALYAGMQQDFVEDSQSVSYSLNYSASDIGAILNRPATPINYTGVVSGHSYLIEGEKLPTDINDRVNGKDGSYAGLVNTKYSDAYKTNFGLDVKEALAFNNKNDDVQPLMIYNNSEDSYGFIGSDNSMASSAYAKVSVKVRVVGDAVAYIYLVDVSGKTKSVMQFDTDKLALDKAENLEFKVTKDMMDSNGWTTVTFYVGAGATAKNFRVELWNGSRDGQSKSKGFVFYDEISVSTSGAFSEPLSVANAFTEAGNPLYSIGLSIKDSAKTYTRKLTDVEKQFNNEQSDSATKISYNPSYVWAKDATNIYAIFNTIDPVVVDPYESETEEEGESSGCVAETDPSTFWLSFSSILLGVVLVLAIIMLIAKNVRRRRKANASDAKSHYTIVSRTKIKKPAKKEEIEEVVSYDETDEEQVVEEEITEENEQPAPENAELDDYVYGEVQDFGEEKENSENQETADESSENKE